MNKESIFPEVESHLVCNIQCIIIWCQTNVRLLLTIRPEHKTCKSELSLVFNIGVILKLAVNIKKINSKIFFIHPYIFYPHFTKLFKMCLQHWSIEK